MSDPALYCSWLYRPFCITQSEWAAWTQAILTILTFAIALIAQRRTQKAAEEKQDAIRAAAERKEDMLRADAARREASIAAQANEAKKNSDALSALAAAIPLKNRLLDTFSIGQVLCEKENIQSLSVTFANSDRLLDLRNFAGEAARLMDASKPVLRAVHTAELLWGYLEVRKDVHGADPESVLHIQSLAGLLFKQSVLGINALDTILSPPADVRE